MGGMNIIDRIAALTERTGYRPKWSALGPNADITFSFRAFPAEARKELEGVKEDDEEAADASLRAFLRRFVTDIVVEGESLGQEQAISALMQYPVLRREITVASHTAQSVQDVPTVDELVAGATEREADIKGSGLHWLATQVFEAKGGRNSEGNG